MEKWCILPDNLLQKLHKDSSVLHSLTRFCECTADELFDIFQKRNITEGDLWYGYKKHLKRNGKKTRRLKEPYDTLKKVQETIKNRLSYIPVSLSATGGKPWDSVDKNVEPHRKNQYLITLDIKNAYPSITTHRVYKNLEWAFAKPLKYRCPLLESDEEKDLFIRAITHLCVSENELPQWACTSTQIQNIVMASFDRKIEKKIPELSWSHVVYSRYADDMTISFPHFSTMEVLKEKMEHYRKKFNYELGDGAKDKIYAAADEFSKDTFIITDNFEFSYLQEKIERMRWLIHVDYRFERKEKEGIISALDSFKKNIKYTNRRIDAIQKEIIDIIWSEWRKINIMKSRTRTPQSNREREINGMTFDREGNRGINKKKRSQYMRLFGDLIQLSIHELSNNIFYRKKFDIAYGNDDKYISSVISTLDWCYQYLTKVYGTGKIPKDLETGYQRAMKRWKNNSEVESKHILFSSSQDKENNADDNDLPF